MDATNSYSNISEDDFSFYYKFLKDKNLNYKTIINKSMKYMRILNSCIVDIGTFSNEDDRVTYWSVSKQFFKVGKTFRIANWLSTSENKQALEDFYNGDDNDQILVEFRIPKECYNAGKINEFGQSYYPAEEETLIPPYTVVKFMIKEDKHIVLEVAKDNQDFNLDTEVSFVLDADDDSYA